MNFESQKLTLKINPTAQTLQGKSLIFFSTTSTGHAYFQFDGQVQSAKLNGQTVQTFTVQDPDGAGYQFIALDQSVTADEISVLELEFTLPADRLSFENGGVGLMTDMTDLSTGRFFERWGPSSFEDDAFSMVLKIQLEETDSVHQVFANGAITKLGPLEWQVSFPAHYTTSSFFLHLTNRSLFVKKASYQGIEKTIPLIVYSASESLAATAMNRLAGLFAEIERDFGPYPHDQFVAYIHSGGGGMEYVGATITGLGALGHELFHSWFARGVMPAEGRSGWIDEAMASWRDYGYFQASSLLTRPPTILAAFSPYRRSTPSNCYKDGRALLSELDVHFAAVGGLKPIMKDFAQRYKYRVVTTEEFSSFLEAKSGLTVAPFFQRYIFGVGETLATTGISVAADHSETEEKSLHPSPLTEEELQNLR